MLKKSKDDSRRLAALEKNFESIQSQLLDIKSLCTAPAVAPTVVVPPTTMAPKVNNPWSNPTKLKIMRDNLGNAPDFKILEDKIPSELGKTIISHSLKDGSTVISCSSKNNVPALEKIVAESFPTHKVTQKNPSKSVIKIVGFKTEYTSEDFFKLLFSKNPSLLLLLKIMNLFLSNLVRIPQPLSRRLSMFLLILGKL